MRPVSRSERKRTGRPRWSPEDTGLELVDAGGPGSPKAPTRCPHCGESFSEVQVFEESLAVGDGPTYTDAEIHRGFCPVCGWVDA